MKKVVVTGLFVFVTLIVAGCHNKRYLVNSQIKYLNTAGGRPYVMSRSGKNIDVDLKNDLIVTVASGRRFVFKYPYTCTLQPDGKTIIVNSKNYTEATIPMNSITSVAIKEPSGFSDTMQGVVYTVTIVAGVALGILLIPLAL